MDKRFIIKIYELDGTYIKTLNPDLLMSEVSFSDKTNGGQGQCVIELNLPIDDFDEGGLIGHMKVVRIYESNQVFSPTPRLIYSGYVSQYVPHVGESGESVSLTLLGLVSLLSNAHYDQAGDFSFNKVGTPDAIMKDVVDSFNLAYPGSLVSYSGGFIAPVATSVDFDFDNTKWLDALKAMATFADGDWWWRVGEDGQVYLQDRPSVATHILTLGKDVDDLSVPKNNEKIVNRYRLTWGESPITTTVYEDAPSQTLYGIRDLPERDAKIRNLTTANLRGAKILADSKNPKVEAKVSVNTNYDIESIKPGHTVSVRNAGTLLPSNMLITAVQYTPDRVTLTLENQTPSFADTFIAAVDALV